MGYAALNCTAHSVKGAASRWTSWHLRSKEGPVDSEADHHSLRGVSKRYYTGTFVVPPWWRWFVVLLRALDCRCASKFATLT